MSRRPGLLAVASDAVQKSVWFRRRRDRFAASTSPRPARQILYGGKLVARALTEAERHQVPGKRFRRRAPGAQADRLRRPRWGIKHQIEEILYSVFRFARAASSPRRQPPAGELAHFSIDTNNVLMEGYQRIDEWGADPRAHRSPQTVLTRPAAAKEKLDERLERLLRLMTARARSRTSVRAAQRFVGEFTSSTSSSWSLRFPGGWRAPPRRLRQRLLRSLSPSDAFQVVLIHNLLPGAEAAELVSTVRRSSVRARHLEAVKNRFPRESP